MKSVLGLVLFLLSVTSASASVWGQAVPQCLDDFRTPMGLNNQTVLKWRTSTQNQFKSRGFIQGVITNIFPDQTGHAHFAVNLDQASGGDIEIIYNQEFGHLPNLAPGMTVVACGDYITAGPQSRLPSPMGAIIHWVHYNPGDRDGGRHPHGFLMINGQTFGYSAQTAGNAY
jgi:hypothetical protein